MNGNGKWKMVEHTRTFFHKGSWIRTNDYRNQNPMPYRLAMPLKFSYSKPNTLSEILSARLSDDPPVHLSFRTLFTDETTDALKYAFVRYSLDNIFVASCSVSGV